MFDPRPKWDVMCKVLSTKYLHSKYWHIVSSQLMLTSTIILVVVIAIAYLWLSFQYSTLSCKSQITLSFHCKAMRIPLASIPPVNIAQTLQSQPLSHVAKIIYISLCSLDPKPETISCFPSVWTSTGSQWTHQQTDGRMNELIMGSQLDGADQKIHLGPLAFFKVVFVFLAPNNRANGQNPSNHSVTSGLKCSCLCLPPLAEQCREWMCPSKAGELSEFSNPQGEKMSFLKTVLNIVRHTFFKSLAEMPESIYLLVSLCIQ